MSLGLLVSWFRYSSTSGQARADLKLQRVGAYGEHVRPLFLSALLCPASSSTTVSALVIPSNLDINLPFRARTKQPSKILVSRSFGSTAGPTCLSRPILAPISRLSELPRCLRRREGTWASRTLMEYCLIYLSPHSPWPHRWRGP